MCAITLAAGVSGLAVGGGMCIFVKTIDRVTIELVVNFSDTIDSVKAKLFDYPYSNPYSGTQGPE
jgi:hypothetical protein